ncbi:MAG: DUF4156 domain-containing protein [Wenzhouxiangella sp.]
MPSSSLKTIIALILATCLMNGCTWVRSEPGAERVRVADANAVRQCERLGQTTVSLRDRVGALQRRPGRVADELAILGRNSALEIGGDTIVADGPVQDGQRRFIIYRCGS